MPPPFHGSCLCGQVGFEVTADPITITTCHCTNCKKYTGTAFTSNIVFPAGSAKISRGQPFVSTYHDADQDTKNPLTRIFCSRCSSPLYNLGGDAGKTLAVFYSALDDFDPDPAGAAVPPPPPPPPPSPLSPAAVRPQGDRRRQWKWATAAVPKVEYYTKDRLHWVVPIVGAQQARTKPGRD